MPYGERAAPGQQTQAGRVTASASELPLCALQADGIRIPSKHTSAVHRVYTSHACPACKKRIGSVALGALADSIAPQGAASAHSCSWRKHITGSNSSVCPGGEDSLLPHAWVLGSCHLTRLRSACTHDSHQAHSACALALHCHHARARPRLREADSHVDRRLHASSKVEGEMGWRMGCRTQQMPTATVGECQPPAFSYN